MIDDNVINYLCCCRLIWKKMLDIFFFPEMSLEQASLVRLLFCLRVSLSLTTTTTGSFRLLAPGL